jgi:transposase
MLSLDDAIRVRALFRSLGSLAAVSRATGYDVKTVSRALSRDYSAPASRSRPVVIDKWLSDLIMANRAAFNLNHKNRLTPARAHELLSSIGFSVSLRTVERRFRVLSERLGDSVGKSAALRLTPPPGSFQVDFGLVDAAFGGDPLSLSLLICSSAYSNGCAAVACRCQDAANLFWGLDACFVQLGGVPPFLRFDNLAPAVSSFRHGRKKTDAFTRFEAHHGFDVEFCNPASGWEKGNVENKVQYIRERFFVPVPSVPSLDDLNASLALWCRDDMRRDHYLKHRPIRDLFLEDQAAFLPFNSSFDYWDTVGARTDLCGFVPYRSNLYFVDEHSARRSVIVRASVDTVEILSEDGELLASHDRCYAFGASVKSTLSHARHLAKKLNALGNVGRDRADGLALRDALRHLDEADRVPHILAFLDGGRLADILDAIEAQRAPLFKYNSLLQDKPKHGN